MITYILIAISFGIVYHIRYTMEILRTIEDLILLLIIEEDEHNYKPAIFGLVLFLFNTIFMPIIFFYIHSVGREIVIKDVTGAVMKSYFKLQEK